jgi:hypothetical protein
MEYARDNGSPALTHTLNDLRVERHDYAASGGLSARILRPVLIAVIVLAVGAAIVWKVKTAAARETTSISAPTAPTGPVVSTPVPDSEVQSVAKLAPMPMPMPAPMLALDAVKPAAATQQVAHQRVAQLSPARSGKSERAASGLAATTPTAPMPAPAFSAPAVVPQAEVPPAVTAPVVEEKPVALPAPVAPPAEAPAQ